MGFYSLFFSRVFLCVLFLLLPFFGKVQCVCIGVRRRNFFFRVHLIGVLGSHGLGASSLLADNIMSSILLIR